MRKSFTSKEKILDKAAKLFSESGFPSTSMSSIAKSLNITKPALYYHFDGKKDLYLRLLDSYSQKIDKIFEKDLKEKTAEEKLSSLIRSYFSLVQREKILINFSTHRDLKVDKEIKEKFSELREKVENYFSDALKEIYRYKKTTKEDLKFLVSFLVGLMDRFLMEVVFWGKRLNLKRRTEQILKIISLF